MCVCTQMSVTKVISSEWWLCFLSELLQVSCFLCGGPLEVAKSYPIVSLCLSLVGCMLLDSLICLLGVHSSVCVYVCPVIVGALLFC